MKPFEYQKPESLNLAISQRRTAGSDYLGGGTNLVDLMKKHIANPEKLVDVTAAAPHTVEEVEQGLRIGGSAKNSALADNLMVKARYPLLSKSILAGATPQIRNMASCAGNLLQRTRCPYFYDINAPCNKRNPGSGCSAIAGSSRIAAIFGHSAQCIAVHPSDFCVGLAALDARVNILDAEGKNQSIPFEDFHKLPGNNPHLDNNLPEGALIVNIEVPKNNFHKNYSYLKLRDRDSYAFALVSVAAALDLNNGRIVDARLACGGIAHKPWRLRETEQFLKGKSPSDNLFAEAAEHALRGAVPQQDNAYKVTLLRGAVQVALQQCMNA